MTLSISSNHLLTSVCHLTGRPGFIGPKGDKGERGSVGRPGEEGDWGDFGDPVR